MNSFFGCFNNQTRQPKKSGVSAAAVIPCWHILILHLTIGLIDHRKALAQGFEASKNIIIGNTVFRLGIAKGKTWPSWRFFFLSRQGNGKKQQQRVVKEAPKQILGIMIFFDWNPVIVDRGKFGDVFFRDYLPSSCSGIIKWDLVFLGGKWDLMLNVTGSF